MTVVATAHVIESISVTSMNTEGNNIECNESVRFVLIACSNMDESNDEDRKLHEKETETSNKRDMDHSF